VHQMGGARPPGPRNNNNKPRALYSLPVRCSRTTNTIENNMSFITIVPSILSFLGTGVKGFFGLKSEQQKIVSDAISTLRDVNSTEKDRAIAFAQYMAAESSNGYWLSACIRPLMALSLMILVGCWFFGYTPPNINAAMPPFIEKAVDTLMVFMGVYVPGRSIEKIVTSVTNSRIIQQYLSKYLK
jgi:hypothetical protein